jgi:predicted nuclease of predicted toxin-antitoxin system
MTTVTVSPKYQVVIPKNSIIYATARKFEALLWTRDADFKDLPGVEYFP